MKQSIFYFLIFDIYLIFFYKRLQGIFVEIYAAHKDAREIWKRPKKKSSSDIPSPTLYVPFFLNHFSKSSFNFFFEYIKLLIVWNRHGKFDLQVAAPPNKFFNEI